MKKDNILQFKNVNMRFGPTHANKNISVDITRGEIRGFAGENGSGKSTLMSILAGINTRTDGDIILNGEPYNPSNPIDALDNRISIVVQELGVVNSLSNDVNIYLSRLSEFQKGGYINLKKLNRAAQDLLEKWEITGVPLKQTSELASVETRKMVELARALSTDPDIVILDEITQALSQNNRNKLYKIVRKLKENGKTVLVISHDLQELIEMTDSITVLKDGEIVGTYESSSMTEDNLKGLMIGRTMSGHFYREDREASYEDKVVLEVDRLHVLGTIEEVSFELHKGEILAVCGLSDSGMHELGKAVYGVLPRKSGSVRLMEKNLEITSCRQAVANGMSYVPKDRDGEAMMLRASIKDNFCLPSIMEIRGLLGYISNKKMEKFSQKAIDDYGVKCRELSQIAADLSGGNKQKINLGRWFMRDTDIFIMDSPTRGVDVGVKAYIYQLMAEAKRNGKSIILIADELTEALGMADRILVLRNGRVAGMMNRSDDFTEAAVFEVMI